MCRNLQLLLGLVMVCLLACNACYAAKEVVELSEAQADPDFAIQGEYVGEGTLQDGSKDKVGAQVIALGNGEFRAVITKGGLPGAGWERGGERFMLNGKADALAGEKLTGKIADGKFTITNADGKAVIKLQRTERKSDTLGAKAPEGAIVIFDGKNLDMFEPAEGHLRDDGTLLSGVTTKDLPADYKLHLEFRLSWMPEARGQGRSNSGVYLHDCYECQVLDSFGLDGKNNECGGFYQVCEPKVNMCLPPMQWQTYDIDLTAPKYEGDKKVSNARITVRHNGVLIHDDVEFKNATPGREPEGPAPRPLHLQGHGNHVLYRNIWLEEKK